MVKIGDWLSEGWALIKDDIVTFAVASLLAGIITVVTLTICAPAMTVGLYMMVFKKMRGEQVAIGDVFQGFQKFGPAFVVYLVVGIGAGIVGVVINLIPVIGQIISPLVGFIIGAVIFYTWQLVAEREIGPIEAITASLDKVKPDFVMYCVCALVYGLINAVGMAICGIGALVTTPLVMAATALAYRDNFGMEGVAAAPASPPAAPPAPPPAAVGPAPEPKPEEPAAPAPEVSLPDPPAPEPSAPAPADIPDIPDVPDAGD